ncbi:hypothetical protein HT746_18700 [Burkholderia pyrrocinia]|nr:hypothetical protein [Burkholderia pyrrocinia]NTX29136.1 hypothetical protein [Burkholderia pyrrocinia]
MTGSGGIRPVRAGSRARLAHDVLSQLRKTADDARAVRQYAATALFDDD